MKNIKLVDEGKFKEACDNMINSFNTMVDCYNEVEKNTRIAKEVLQNCADNLPVIKSIKK